MLLFLLPKNVFAEALKPGQGGERGESKSGRGRKPRQRLECELKPDAAHWAWGAAAWGEAAVPRQGGPSSTAADGQVSRPSSGRRVGAGPAPRAPSRRTASSGPRTPGRGSRIPRPSRPPGARVRASPLGPKLLCAAGPSRKVRYFLLRSGEGEARDATGLGCGRGGRRRPGGDPAPPARPGPRSLFAPTKYPPGGEILLHAQQSLPQGLQHLLRHRDSSPRVSERAAALAPAPVARAPARQQPPRPRPARGPRPRRSPSAFRPRSRSGSTPRRPRSRSGPRRAGLGWRKGAALPSPPGTRGARTASPYQFRLSRFSL